MRYSPCIRGVVGLYPRYNQRSPTYLKPSGPGVSGALTAVARPAASRASLCPPGRCQSLVRHVIVVTPQVGMLTSQLFVEARDAVLACDAVASMTGALLGLRCRVHFEFVPSEANIADWPTRADKVGLIPDWFVWTPIAMLPAHLLSLSDPRVMRLWAGVLSLHPRQLPD